MAWLFVPATEDSTSDSNWQSEPITEPYVTLSGKAQQRPLSWRGWKTRPWIKLLSGMILPHSTASRGVERWISSLPDSLASRSPSPESGTARQTTGTCGHTSTELSGSADHRPYFLRTCPASSQLSLFTIDPKSQATSVRWTTPSRTRQTLVDVTTLKITGNGYTGDFSENTGSAYCSISSANWKHLVTELSRESLQRWKSAPATSGRGCSSWPTATSGKPTNPNSRRGAASLEGKAKQWPTPNAGPQNDTDTNWQKRRAECKERHGNNGFGLTLGMATQQWQTPATDSFRSRGGDRKDEQWLDQQARAHWPTPRSVEWKGTGLVGSKSHTHRDKLGYLDARASRFSHPDPETEQPGSESSPQTPNSNQPSPRRLNPNFVCYLMGLPPGWVDPTSCECSETESYRSWLHTHSAALQELLGIR